MRSGHFGAAADKRFSFDINTVMAGILVLTGFALALDAAVGRIERRLMKWQPA